MTAFINKYINQLAAKNYKAINLALLRVFVCSWLLIRVCSGWQGFEILYGKEAVSLANRLALQSIHYQYQYFIAIFLLVIFLNLLGIAKNAMAALLYLLYYFFYQLNIAVVNGGDTTAKYILLYLAFADSYQYFTLQKKSLVNEEDKSSSNTWSNLAALSIMIQLCLVYLSSAIAKLQTADWVSGQATYYAFLSERYGGGYLLKGYLKNEWFIKAATFYALAFECLFPFLIWIKKWQTSLMIAGILLHAGIAVTMMLYSFQVFYLILYIMFLPAEKIQSWLLKFPKKKASSINTQ